MANLLSQAKNTLEGVKIAPISGEIIYDQNVGKVSIDAVFPMGTEKWNISGTPSRAQPRQVFNEQELESLADSIVEHGQQVPIVVRRAPSSMSANRVVQYGIVNGERRWRAMKMRGMTEILIRVTEASTRAAYRLSIIGDIHNISHNSLERGQSLIQCEQDMVEEMEEFLREHLPHALENPLSNVGYAKLQKVEYLAPIWMRRVFERAFEQGRKPKVTDDDIAGTVGITPKRIRDLTKITTLEPEFKAALLEAQINTRQASALLRLPDKKTRKKLYREILDDGLSGVDAEKRAKTMLEPAQRLAGGWSLKAPDAVPPMRAALVNVQSVADILRRSPQPEKADELRALSAQILENLAEIDGTGSPKNVE